MADELHERLEQWGDSGAPSVDGAFANRLEHSLRTSALNDHRPAGVVWFRPGLVVVGLVMLVAGLVYAATGEDAEAEFANGDVPVTSVPNSVGPTTAVPDPLGSTIAPQSTSPLTTHPPDVTVSPTTVTPTTVAPATTVSTTTEAPTTVSPTTAAPTTSDVATTNPASSPEVLVTISAEAGARLRVAWRAVGVDSVRGWVVIQTSDGAEHVLVTSREAEVRRLVVDPVADTGSIRVEGRSQDGMVVVASDEVRISRGE